MSYKHPILTAGVASNQSITEAVTDARHEVGTRGSLSDGRVFYYASFVDGTASTAGELLTAPATDTDYVNIAVATSLAIDGTSLALTLGGSNTHAANAFVGGYVVVNDATGEGYTYRISASTAVSAGTAITVTLDDPIVIALVAGTSQCTLLLSPFAEVVATAGTTSRAAGVCQFVVPIGSTNTQYFWIQTWGTSAGQDDANIVDGNGCQNGATAGQFDIVSAAYPSIARQVGTGVTGEHTPKFLTIAP
jgi:hypothetical protein